MNNFSRYSTLAALICVSIGLSSQAFAEDIVNATNCTTLITQYAPKARANQLPDSFYQEHGALITACENKCGSYYDNNSTSGPTIESCKTALGYMDFQSQSISATPKMTLTAADLQSDDDDSDSTKQKTPAATASPTTTANNNVNKPTAAPEQSFDSTDTTPDQDQSTTASPPAEATMVIPSNPNPVVEQNSKNNKDNNTQSIRWY